MTAETPKALTFSPERFAALISRRFSSVKTAAQVAAYITEVSDNSAVPWHVLPELEQLMLSHLTVTGENACYQLVELHLAALEESADASYCWVDKEKVEAYTQLHNPPPLIFASEAERVILVDGCHRLKAALTRGDASILAWVPLSSRT